MLTRYVIEFQKDDKAEQSSLPKEISEEMARACLDLFVEGAKPHIKYVKLLKATLHPGQGWETESLCEKRFHYLNTVNPMVETYEIEVGDSYLFLQGLAGNPYLYTWFPMTKETPIFETISKTLEWAEEKYPGNPKNWEILTQPA